MKKVRQHKLSDKLPVLAAIILCIIGLIVTQLVTFLLSTLLHFVIPVFPANANPIIVLGVGFLALFLFKLWYKPEYSGSVVYSEYGKVWILLIGYVLFFGYGVLDMVMKHETYKLTLTAFCMALFAGVLEETVFRGLLIPVMMRKKKNLAVALFVSSAIFALTHGANIFVGADPGYTLVQVGSSFLLGVFLGATYLLSGNIIIPIAIHVIHDILALGVQSKVTEQGVITASVTAKTFIEEIPVLLLCIFTIIIVFQKKNRDTISSIWDKKWKITD